ncbi:MAG: glutathione-disulfide reductase [Paracoccus denitrificans]|nr:MAG: glutathione-disulfide reductase [Paracoccus denitrificans]PZO83190.1 MAG: glutathione-disulfide reductase [Paracoccus denitrificans]
MSFDYDLFVIGGGSGGVRAARVSASQHGARVGLAEESRMGGTCVIRGCVPKKLMIFASDAPRQATEARGYGWTGADAGQFDWTVFRSKLDAELNRLEGFYLRGVEVAGVDVYRQRAHLIDAHTVEMADGTRKTAAHILIAAGGRPTRPDIPGADLCMISDDLFLMDKLPDSMLVVGGGFVACEFATIVSGLGVDTTLVHRGDLVLRGFDHEGRRLVTSQLSDIGVTMMIENGPAKIEAEGDKRRVTFKDGSVQVFGAVMLATGRSPYTKGLGLEEIGVRIGDKGEVVVDDWSQTSVPSIYAVGDITDRVNLTPVAIREGHDFADTVFGNQPRHMDHGLVASAVYTRPFELGTVGLTEAEAEKICDIEVFEASFRPMKTLFAGSEARCIMKLIVAEETRKVLGCHIFAPDAGEMIQLVAIPMGMDATKEDFDRTVAVHPTLSEELVTMRTPVRRSGPTHAAAQKAAGVDA